MRTRIVEMLLLPLFQLTFLRCSICPLLHRDKVPMRKRSAIGISLVMGRQVKYARATDYCRQHLNRRHLTTIMPAFTISHWKHTMFRVNTTSITNLEQDSGGSLVILENTPYTTIPNIRDEMLLR